MGGEGGRRRRGEGIEGVSSSVEATTSVSSRLQGEVNFRLLMHKHSMSS